MTTPWNDQLIVRVDDEYDRDRASNGDSRYAAYLRQNANLFRDAWSDEPAPVEDPVEFAVHAWRVATGPVMSPGYVQWRSDLHGVSLHRDENDGTLFAEVRVPLRHGQVGGNGKRFPYTWQDWETEQTWGPGDLQYPGLAEPRSYKQPAVLATAVVRVPGHGWSGLIAPTAYEGAALLTEAMMVLDAVVEQVNADAAPIVARLLG